MIEEVVDSLFVFEEAFVFHPINQIERKPAMLGILEPFVRIEIAEVHEQARRMAHGAWGMA